MTVFRKSLKGTEEIALRAHGLSNRLRPYLVIVDGVKSAAQLAADNPGLPEVEMVLRSLEAEGFLAIVDAGVASNVVSMPVARVGNGAPMQAPPQTQQASSVSDMTIPMVTLEAMANAQPAHDNAARAAARFDQLKRDMIGEVTVLLGRDAPLVIAKIQNCASPDALFASMMGLKKVIQMYADGEKADAFVKRFSTLADL